MSGLSRTGLLIVVSSLMVGCGANTTAQDAAEQEAAALAKVDSAGDTIRETRIERLYVTLRGKGIRVQMTGRPDTAGLESTDTTQVHAADPESLLELGDGRAGLAVSIDGRDWHRFSMDTDADHEGKLFRIHIDRPEGLENCGYTAVAMGYYSELWSKDAVEKDKTKCIPCGEILVCGVNPTCP